MKRRHEEIAKAEFDTFLSRLFPAADISWEEVPQTQEPPDWYLEIDGDRYAVEATSVFPICFGQMPSSTISAALHQFIDEIEKTAIKEGSLAGAYVVSLSPIPDFPAKRIELSRHLLMYIRDTQCILSAPEAIVFEVGHQAISVKKVHDQKNYVAEVICFDAKWEGEVQQELSNTLAAVLERKKAKLLHVCEPIILIILDAYCYADTSQWRQAALEASSSKAFHCVCRIAPGSQTEVLWATQLNWQSKLI